MLGADPLPRTASELSAWISEHPGVERCAAQQRAVRFLQRPPLPLGVKLPYTMLFNGAAETVPPNVGDTLDICVPPRSATTGRLVVSGLRWALGSSPSWHKALLRSGADVPVGLFKQAMETP